MIRNYKCSFCRTEIPKTTGQMFVKTDGSILRFCDAKCKKSMVKMKRNPRKLKWTKSYERSF